MPHSFRALPFLLLLAVPAIADDGNAVTRVRAHEPQMSYLQNSSIKLGVDLALGGSITYLSCLTPAENLINSYDFGRQIQMSYYSGPVPFHLPGKDPKPSWNFIGWNPIQVGDAFGNSSKLLESSNDGQNLYVKCIPMHWPLDNVPGECTYECWLLLEGPVVHARCRFINHRPDATQYPARHQELPALYTNGSFHRLFTYAGDQPFKSAPLTRIVKTTPGPYPWSNWTATESWAALVNDAGFGLGIYSPGNCDFKGGFAGKPGAGGPHDNPTGYIAPEPLEIIDANITHEYHYDLIVGNLTDIRKHVYDHASRPKPPAYSFDKDRQGWHYFHAHDTGWPIQHELNILLDQVDPQLLSPISIWPAADGATLVIEAACHSTRHDARIYWRHLADRAFNEAQSLPFTLMPDDAYHTYRINLAANRTWTGSLTQLRLDPVATGDKTDWIHLKSLRLEH
jgi:hypothetical protein